MGHGEGVHKEKQLGALGISITFYLKKCGASHEGVALPQVCCDKHQKRLRGAKVTVHYGGKSGQAHDCLGHS